MEFLIVTSFAVWVRYGYGRGTGTSLWYATLRIIGTQRIHTIGILFKFIIGYNIYKV